MDERIAQVVRCMAELEACEKQFRTADDPLMVLMGQCDWLWELHHQLHNN